MIYVELEWVTPGARRCGGLVLTELPSGAVCVSMLRELTARARACAAGVGVWVRGVERTRSFSPLALRYCLSVCAVAFRLGYCYILHVVFVLLMIFRPFFT